MRTNRFLALAALSVISGCSAAHPSGEPASGIYDLSVAGELDRCSPARDTGAMGRVGLVTAGDVLSLGVPDPTRASVLHVSLSRDAGYHDVFSVPLVGCTAATLERSFTVIASNGEGVSLAYRETWSGMESCGDAMRSIMPAAPTTDCEADLGLTYRLAEPCAASCEVGILPSGPACLCD
jgi:hypothetical protein